MSRFPRFIGTLIILAGLIGGFAVGPATVSAAAGWLLTGPTQPETAASTYNAVAPYLVALPDDRALVITPFEGSPGNELSRGYLYNLQTNSWSTTSEYNVMDGSDAPVMLTEGRVLLTGGAAWDGIDPSSFGTLSASQVYDPATNRWTAAAPMFEPHAGHSATLLADGTVLIAGGITGSGEGAAFGYSPTDAERYDPRTNKWTKVGTEPKLRLTAATTGQAVVRLHDGRVLAIGGTSDYTGTLALTELFNPATNSWSSAGTLITPRVGANAVVLPDGRVLVVGGNDGSGKPLASTEIYDPVANKWTTGPSMSTGLSNLTSVLLHNGTVLTVGSATPTTGNETAAEKGQVLAEIYNPSSNSWASAPPMPFASSHPAVPSAAVLTNGYALVVRPNNATGLNPFGELYVSQLPGPTQRQLPPGGPLPANQVYFPETGHYLSNGFLAFWQHFGGLAVFGYPISDEFQQNGVTVQYFQRARFEWHPGSDPARYDVELGLLGDQAAITARQQTPAPFAPIQAANNADCTFYAVTGHRLCFGFRAYWQSHGGLANFGYPISEEFKDSTTGLTVQYFERAVFEYHPNNPIAYQVELRLLGTEQYGPQP